MLEVPQTNNDLLRSAISHIILNCDPERLGAVKLHKVLYYVDMLWFLRTGRPFTYSTYRKRPYGPTCDSILGVIQDLESEGRISINSVEYYGYEKREYLPINLDQHDFGDEEIRLFKEIIEFVCYENSAKTISDFSHDYVWEMMESGSPIPYENAIHLIPNTIEKAAFEWATIEVDKIALDREKSETSNEENLAGADARDFRSRLDEVRRHRAL